jgi:DNA modification methylase
MEQLDDIKDRKYLTHAIHPYPAKFIPQIPASIIQEYSQEGDRILDPFCGSGTTLLEAIIRGRTARGVDLNPIATLISRVKTSCFALHEHGKVEGFLDYLRDIVARRAHLHRWLPHGMTLDAPRFHNREHWFSENVTRELMFLLDAVAVFDHEEGISEFLKLCFSAIVVQVSNQDSETRWVARARDLPESYVLRAFIRKCETNLQKITSLSAILNEKPYNVEIFTGNAQELHHFIATDSTDLILTSPPYLNSFDYYLYHKLRMFWLGFDHKKVQEGELGSRNKHCDRHESMESFVLSMKVVAGRLHGVLRNHGTCALVVGDSICRGALVKAGALYQKIMSESGFFLVDQVSFDQRRYSRSFPNYKKIVKNSYILIFRKK